MTIGKEAHEILTRMAMRLSTHDCAELLQVLDDCTDALEVGLPDVNWPAVVHLMRWTGKQVLAEPLMAAQLLSEADTLERWLETAGQKEKQG